jgi:hypothetical protein
MARQLIRSFALCVIPVFFRICPLTAKIAGVRHLFISLRAGVCTSNCESSN